MEVNKFRSNKSILIIAMTVTIFASCAYSGKQNNILEQPSDSIVYNTDSSKWLKSSRGIRDILEDVNGNLWFSSPGFLAVFTGSELKYFTEEDGFVGTGGNIHEDANGIIWVETSIGDSLYGVSSYDGHKFKFNEFPDNEFGEEWNVAENDIWFSKPLKSSGKWSGPPGVYRYRNGKFKFLAFPLPKTNNDHNIYWATSKAIKGKDGRLWFATITVVLGFKDGKFILIDQEKMDRKNDPIQVGVRGIYEDSMGKLWMADNGKGFLVYEGDSVVNFTKLHQLDKGDSEGNTLHRAFSMAEDGEGNMWFGTVYSGIWRYKPATEKLTNYSKNEGFSSQSIWTIYKAKNGELLFAGEGPGAVYKFNGTSFDRIF